MIAARQCQRAASGESSDLEIHLPNLRATLERERSFRVEQLMDLAPTVRASRNQPESENESPGTRTLREIAEVVAAGARRALIDIEQALSRMHTGKYGLCEDCGSKISPTILRAIPQTRTCLLCRQPADPSMPGGDR